MRRLGLHPGRSLVALLALVLSTLSGARGPATSLFAAEADEQRSVSRSADDVVVVRSVALAAEAPRASTGAPVQRAQPSPAAIAQPAPSPRLGQARGARAP